MPKIEKPPRNGGFTAFLRVWNCINLGVVLSIKLINSTYHLSNLSTQHPQYQNQPLNSPPFFTVDQFPLTRKIKKSGNQNLSYDKPRLPEIPCFLHFFAILFFDFWHQYYALHMAWEDRMNVIWVRPFSETYPLRFWHYRYTGTYPISLWNVYHTFKRQNSILTYATLPITKHLQLHVAYCF